METVSTKELMIVLIIVLKHVTPQQSAETGQCKQHCSVRPGDAGGTPVSGL